MNLLFMVVSVHFFCKNSKEGEGLLLTNGDDVKK